MAGTGGSSAAGFGAGLAKGLAGVFLSKRQTDVQQQQQSDARQQQLTLSLLPHVLENAQDPNDVTAWLQQHMDLTNGKKVGKGELDPNAILHSVLGPSIAAGATPAAGTGGQIAPGAPVPGGDVARDVTAVAMGASGGTPVIPSSTPAAPATPAQPAPTTGAFSGIRLMTPEQKAQRQIATTTATETAKLTAQSDAKLSLAARMREADPTMSVEDSLIAVGLKIPQDQYGTVPRGGGIYKKSGVGAGTITEAPSAATPAKLTGAMGERVNEIKALHPDWDDARVQKEAASGLQEEHAADRLSKQANLDSIQANRAIQKTLLDLQVQQGGITPNNAASLTSTLRKDWTKAVQPFQSRQTYVAKLAQAITPDASGKTMIQRNRNAATQDIINSFNRLLEEGNTVREGEYKRSEELAPFLTRLPAMLTALSEGGGKLTDEQLTALAQEGINIARVVGSVHESGLRDLRQAMTNQLGRYKLPPEDVFGLSKIGAPEFSAVLNNKKYPFPNQAALDLFKRKFPAAQ